MTERFTMYDARKKLIEQQKEIERLQLELKYKLDQSERIKNLEAEIERLQEEVKQLTDHVERLKEANRRNIKEINRIWEKYVGGSK